MRSFRTYEDLILHLPEGLLVLSGANGVGKTNLLEALAWVGSGTSPRTAAESECVRAGTDFFRLEATVLKGDSQHTRAVTYELGKGKTLYTDGEKISSVDAFQMGLPVVIFLPEKLLFMRGAPARRRGTFDKLIAMVEPSSRTVGRSYVQAMVQRNVLLRQARHRDVERELSGWTSQLVEHGENFRSYRATVLDRMAGYFNQRLYDLTGFPQGSVHLQLRGAELETALTECRAMDIRRGSTGAGPHLDDLIFTENGRPLRSRGSTGEQRAALLAWALAEQDLLTDVLGVQPLLLLDEPYAELDPERRRRLSDVLNQRGQVLVTATEPGLVGETENYVHIAEVFGGEYGTVNEWTKTKTPMSAISTMPSSN